MRQIICPPVCQSTSYGLLIQTETPDGKVPFLRLLALSIYVFTDIYLRIYIYGYVFTYMYLRIYIYGYVFTYMYLRIRIYKSMCSKR